MKKIKFLSIIFFQVLLVQFALGQSTATDDKGRPVGTTPNEVVEEEKPGNPVEQLKNGSDLDIPGDYPQAETDMVYPIDLENFMDEMRASATPMEVAQRINRLEEQMTRLIGLNEQLQQENRALFKSLSNCCSANSMNLEHKDAYLLQNAPNPFNASSEINYFLPKDVTDARIEIRDVKGELIETHNLQDGGFGKLDINATKLLSGTFIYSLHIGGDMLDSKVMIITK